MRAIAYIKEVRPASWSWSLQVFRKGASIPFCSIDSTIFAFDYQEAIKQANDALVVLGVKLEQIVY